MQTEVAERHSASRKRGRAICAVEEVRSGTDGTARLEESFIQEEGIHAVLGKGVHK